jgi:acyl-CoA synthetase (AMP-forming)/AMP-acid ligase II
MPNIYQVAMFNAERHPAKVVVSDDTRAFTSGQFCERVQAVAHYLAGLGVGAGDRVAVMAANSIDYLALLYATTLGGFAVVPVNTRYGLGELRHLIADAAPKVCLHDPAFQGLVDELRSAADADELPLWLNHLPTDLPNPPFDDPAAAPLGEWHQAVIRKVFPNAEFSLGFSMTESCVTTIKNRYTSEILSHPGSIDYLWRHVQYRLVDAQGKVQKFRLKEQYLP